MNDDRKVDELNTKIDKLSRTVDRLEDRMRDIERGAGGRSYNIENKLREIDDLDRRVRSLESKIG
jgi:polyhydroxyalkanoate synthesis regulator phasin